jgi:flagellin-like protein
MRKGISPLIATVLLIAFTLSIAGLLGSWLSTLTRTETENLEKSSKEIINCTGAMIDIIGVSCSATDKQFKVAVTNIGSIAMHDFSVFAIINKTQYVNNTGGPNSTYPLLPGEQAILVYGCDNTVYCSTNASIERVRITPGVCPSAWTEKNPAVSCS